MTRFSKSTYKLDLSLWDLSVEVSCCERKASHMTEASGLASAFSDAAAQTAAAKFTGRAPRSPSPSSSRVSSSNLLRELSAATVLKVVLFSCSTTSERSMACDAAFMLARSSPASATNTYGLKGGVGEVGRLEADVKCPGAMSPKKPVASMGNDGIAVRAVCSTTRAVLCMNIGLHTYGKTELRVSVCVHLRRCVCAWVCGCACVWDRGGGWGVCAYLCVSVYEHVYTYIYIYK